MVFLSRPGDNFILEFHLFRKFFAIYQRDMSGGGSGDDDVARAQRRPLLLLSDKSSRSRLIYLLLK